jgi:hypothetical protein
MAITIVKGQTFAAVEQVTNAKLHALVDNATVTGADLTAGLCLLSATVVPLDANGDTTLYTVPASKTCVLHSALLVAGADAGTSDISIGQNGAETDFVGVTNLDNLDAADDAMLLAPVPSATPATLKSYPTGTVIQAQVDNQAGGATNTLYLFGYLF